MKPPVQVNQSIELTITGFGNHGTGVGRYQGFAIFVPQAIPGERARVQITKVKKTYAQARLSKIIQPSEDRVDPLCPIFVECGGCQLQHTDYGVQLRLKRQTVLDALQRIGGLAQAPVRPVTGMKEPWAYRNKVQVPFVSRNGQTIAGFYEAGSHRIVPLEQCLIQPEESNTLFQKIYQLVVEAKIPPYNERTHRGLLRHVMMRRGTYSGQWMVVFVVNGRKLPNEELFISKLIKAVPQLTSVILNENTKRTNTILGQKNRTLYGTDVIFDQIGELTFALSPHTFFQVNPEQTVVLYEKVKQYAALSGSETVIDAYCGAGTIALYLAHEARQVYGVEVVPEAIADAKMNAQINGLSQTEFVCGPAERVMDEWLQQGIQPDVIVVDPPRKGCDASLLQAAAKMQPQRLIYVSCNPSTLARDVAILTEFGFQLQEVQPVDMFPHTSHIESVSLLTRRTNR